MNFLTRLGISAVLSTGYFFLVTEFLQKQPWFDPHKWHIALGLLGGGFLLWVVAFLVQDKSPSKTQGSENHTGRYRSGEVWGDPQAAAPTFLTAGFCGVLLMLLGAVTLAATPSTRATVVAAARSMKGGKSGAGSGRAAEAAAPGSPKSGRAKRSAVPLKLQGVFCTPPKSSAIINGQTVFVGDTVGGAKVTAITSEGVTLNFGGVEETLTPKPPKSL